jgi:IS30 family transposase
MHLSHGHSALVSVSPRVNCARASPVFRRRESASSKLRLISDEVLIRERPAEADHRAVPGHWKGDLILGLDSSGIGTLVERTTRFTMLLHPPRMEDHGSPRANNGPPLAGHGAEAVRDAITSTITALPEQLRPSLTRHQGAELAQRAQLRIATEPNRSGWPVCQPSSSRNMISCVPDRRPAK